MAVGNTADVHWSVN